MGFLTLFLINLICVFLSLLFKLSGCSHGENTDFTSQIPVYTKLEVSLSGTFRHVFCARYIVCPHSAIFCLPTASPEIWIL